MNRLFQRLIPKDWLHRLPLHAQQGRFNQVPGIAALVATSVRAELDGAVLEEGDIVPGNRLIAAIYQPEEAAPAELGRRPAQRIQDGRAHIERADDPLAALAGRYHRAA